MTVTNVHIKTNKNRKTISLKQLSKEMGGVVKIKEFDEFKTTTKQNKTIFRKMEGRRRPKITF